MALHVVHARGVWQAAHLTLRVLPAAEYMTLPASQYSVLDAKRIERIDDDTFRHVPFLAASPGEPGRQMQKGLGRMRPSSSPGDCISHWKCSTWVVGSRQ